MEPAPTTNGTASLAFQRLATDGALAPEPGVVFEHVCCKAIRPNPFDPEVDGQGQEARKEPYLVATTRVRPTASLGLLVFLMGLGGTGAVALGMWGFRVASFIIGTVAGLLFLYTLVSYLLVRGALDQIQLEATRHVMEPVVERGKTFHVALDTQASLIPSRLRVSLMDLHSPGLRPVEPPRMEGIGRLEYTVRAQGRGLLTFKGVEVTGRSGDGLWTQTREYRFRTTIEVSPSIPAVALRSRLLGGSSMPQNMPDFIVRLYRDVENEVTRAYGPGDRLKDVDWKRMAVSGQMITRQRSQEGEQSILLCLDAGRSMLQDQAGFRNLDLGIEFAQEFMEAGLRRNHEVGMLAFNEEEVMDHVRPNRKKMQARRLSLHLRNLAGHHLPDDGEEPVETSVVGNPENLLMGLQHGIRQRQTQLLTLILFSDLRTTPEEIAQGLARAAANGHRAVVMLLPPPKLRPVMAGLGDEEEFIEKRNEEHTLRLRELMMANGVQFLEISPSDDDLKLPDAAEAEPAAR